MSPGADTALVHAANLAHLHLHNSATDLPNHSEKLANKAPGCNHTHSMFCHAVPHAMRCNASGMNVCISCSPLQQYYSTTVLDSKRSRSAAVQLSQPQVRSVGSTASCLG
jgi:hypothetical protein